MRRRRSRLTDRQSERLLEHFVAGTPARPAAELAGVNRNTARLFYHRLRERIAQRLGQDYPLKVAVDVVHAPGIGPRALPVFGLLKRGGNVYAVMLPDARSDTPPSAVRVRPDSIVYADAPSTANVLHMSALHHRRVNDRKRHALGRAQIDSIENFWNQAKRHLSRYHGLPRPPSHPFLTDCAWRLNYGSPTPPLSTLSIWIKSDLD